MIAGAGMVVMAAAYGVYTYKTVKEVRIIRNRRKKLDRLSDIIQKTPTDTAVGFWKELECAMTTGEKQHMVSVSPIKINFVRQMEMGQ